MTLLHLRTHPYKNTPLWIFLFVIAHKKWPYPCHFGKRGSKFEKSNFNSIICLLYGLDIRMIFVYRNGLINDNVVAADVQWDINDLCYEPFQILVSILLYTIKIFQEIGSALHLQNCHLSGFRDVRVLIHNSEEIWKIVKAIKYWQSLGLSFQNILFKVLFCFKIESVWTTLFLRSELFCKLLLKVK